MTFDQIQALWESALRDSEHECDRAYRNYARAPEAAREKLERYFYLVRVCALRSSLAKVHSIGAAALLSVDGFCLRTTSELAQICERDLPAGWMHADPPSGDGMLYRWIETQSEDDTKRRGVLQQVHKIFGRDARLAISLKEERSAMSESGSWMDKAPTGNYWKPGAGRHTAKITDEPKWVMSQAFGKEVLEIPTDRGVFSTAQESLIGPLRDYGQRHKKRVVGATLTFTCNGAEGTDKRYDRVKVE